MKATTCRQYGLPEVLRLEEIDTPAPGAGEVLVRVKAASVNSWDWDNLRGEQAVIRLIHGIRRPKFLVPGSDIAGTVEAVGEGVSAFQPGDEVYGDLSASGWGAFAEFVCAPQNALVLKPESATFEQAAAMPQAAVMALQGIRDYGNTQAGDRVLINGGGGGVGTFAIQLAAKMGAHVTAVDHTRKLEMMRSIGADDVIDYTKEDFVARGQTFDLILDCLATRPLAAIQRTLTENGVYVVVGTSVTRLPAIMLYGRWLQLTGDKRMAVLMHEANKNLSELAALHDDGTLVSVIDRCHPLPDVSTALQRMGDGAINGKAVIRMDA